MKTALALLGVAALGVVAVVIYQNRAAAAPASDSVLAPYSPSIGVNGSGGLIQ